MMRADSRWMRASVTAAALRPIRPMCHRSRTKRVTTNAKPAAQIAANQETPGSADSPSTTPPAPPAPVEPSEPRTRAANPSSKSIVGKLTRAACATGLYDPIATSSSRPKPAAAPMPARAVTRRPRMHSMRTDSSTRKIVPFNRTIVSTRSPSKRTASLLNSSMGPPPVTATGYDFFFRSSMRRAISSSSSSERRPADASRKARIAREGDPPKNVRVRCPNAERCALARGIAGR